MTLNNDINGLVLAGGFSKRMGTDKGDLTYHKKPQKYYICDMMTGLGLETSISIRKEQHQEPDYDYIHDKYENAGMLSGLLSAFKKTNKTWFCVGCDYPLLTAQHLQMLLNKRNKEKDATVFYDIKSNCFIPTIGIYELSIRPILKRNFNQGIYKMQLILKNSNIEIISIEDYAFTSVDNKTDYEKIRKSLYKV